MPITQGVDVVVDVVGVREVVYVAVDIVVSDAVVECVCDCNHVVAGSIVRVAGGLGGGGTGAGMDAALGSGDDATAGEFYEAALRDQNQDLRARMGLARLCLSAGDPEAALAHFRVIMGSGRNCTPELLALLSDICAVKDGGSQYLAALEEYYALQSSSLLALALAGELEKQRGLAAAEAFLRETLTTHPSVSVAASLVLQGLPAFQDHAGGDISSYGPRQTPLAASRCNQGWAFR